MEALLHSVAHCIALAVEAIAIVIVAICSARALADIVSTSFSPTWIEVASLAAVAAIRTFLSYFLDLEMERDGRRAIGGTS